MNRKIISLLMISIVSVSCQSQIVALYKHPGSVLNKSEGHIENEELKLRQSSDGLIYHMGMLIYKPEGEFKFSIYEIYQKFLIITPIPKTDWHRADIYMLGKNKIRIYNLTTQEWSNTDLKGGFFVSIDDKERIITIRKDKHTTEKVVY